MYHLVAKLKKMGGAGLVQLPPPCSDSVRIGLTMGESRESSPCTDSRTASSLELHVVSPSIGPSDVEYRASERRASSQKAGRKRSLRVMEVLVLSAVVLGLLGIYMIPTVFFVLPPLEFQPVSLHAWVTINMQAPGKVR